MIYRIATRVVKCEERSIQKYLSGSGDKTEFVSEPLGWFLTLNLNGTHITFGLGSERPDLKPGDVFRLTGEKVS